MATVILILTTTMICLVFIVSSASSDYVLYNGEVLMAGQNLTNGSHQLTMQANCDLVLYHSGHYDKPMWKSNSSMSRGDGDSNNNQRNRSCYAVLKQNGELVVRRDVHYLLWTSAKKAKKGKYVLVLDPAGHIGIYGTRRWISNNQREMEQGQETTATASGRPSPSSESTWDYVLYSSSGHGRLTTGTKLKYGEYELGFSRHCNLAINNTRMGRTLWQTNTNAATCFLELDSNGELTVKHGSQRLWSNNKKGDRGRYVAVLGFDGRFAIYGPLLWSNAKFDDISSNFAMPVHRESTYSDNQALVGGIVVAIVGEVESHGLEGAIEKELNKVRSTDEPQSSELFSLVLQRQPTGSPSHLSI
ncbi:hypothetical protein HPP92_020879 [Vanilla planifolia]|uniref:Bulb-type lectin domain-containing protein n=1 Tax=Vanilla planifolia TaxID=51239 RepID=A0A835UGA8_VANPL|nr:hypothetical protein HPP92_020879 [Vanilla planifolia]